MYSLKMVNSWK